MLQLLVPHSALRFPEISPVIVSIGPVAIHWYGLGYVLGILFGWWYSKRLLRQPALWRDGSAPMQPEDIDDFLIWAAIGIVAGGRLGYVLFYEPARYLANPLDALAIWQGGMSFHGGLAGTILAMALFARSRGIRVWSLFDVVAAGVPVGIGLVRCTNFINSELWGRVTELPWAVVFPNGGPLPRHPSQIYEALLEGLLLFLVLRLASHAAGKLRTPGFISGLFLSGYGLARIFVEFFREPDAHIGYLAGGWLTMGMLLSLPMVLIGIWAMARSGRQAPMR
jgi:phosphatidylglycerol:prolipoprotein diacylglycerol transferase